MVSSTRPRHWGCIIAYNALGGYFVPTSSSARNCSQHILNGRIFEPRMPEFVAKHVGSGDIVHASPAIKACRLSAGITVRPPMRTARRRRAAM